MVEAVSYGVGVLVVLELAYVLLRRTHLPIRVGVLYHLWSVSCGLVAALTFAPGVGTPAWRVAVAIAALIGAVVVFSLFDSLVFQRPWNPARGPMMPKLARDVLRVVVLAAAILLIATLVLHQPLPAVLVSSTVVSAVIGLALQDILKNVFSGMAIELEKPFERGDWLLLDGQTVQVLDTSWRSVRLRSRDGIDFWEPNSTFSTSRLVNYGSGKRPVGINFHVNLAYDAPPSRVKAALMAVARSIDEVLDNPAPEVYLQAFGDSGIDYRLRVWTTDVRNINRLTDMVNSRTWYQLKREGMAIPFSIRTVLWRAAERDERLQEQRHRQQSEAILRRVRLFDRLDDEAVRRLAAAATYQHFDHGEVLVREGELGESLFVIERGRVTVSLATPDASGDLTLATMEEGAFFGEISLLTGEPRSATVMAEGGCEVLVLSKEALAPLLLDDPKVAESLAAAVVARQARTAAKLEDRRDRLRDAAEGRVEASLLDRIRAFFKLPG